MKLTKSMYYNETAESRELLLYTENSSRLYEGITKSTMAQLLKKIAKGTYEKEKAIIAWYHVATQAAKDYNREYGPCNFSVTDRWTAAVDMESEFFEDYEAGYLTA